MKRRNTISVLLSLCAGLALAQTASAIIIFDGSPGTAAPPATLGTYTMTSFAPDGRALFSNYATVPSPLGGDLGLSPSGNHRKIGSGWATWSHGYTGDVYYSNGATSVTMTMPANAGAFYFYAEPNPFASFTMTATADDGTNSGPIAVNGSSGAKYFGFYVSGGAALVSVTISSSVDFAIGEFGIADLVEAHLPVELASFNLSSRNGNVMLSWQTASEIDNAGFEVQRAGTDSSFKTITSYLNNPSLVGLGTTSHGKSYRYTDGDDGGLQAGRTYLYRLVDVSREGVRKEHSTVSVRIEAASLTADLGALRLYPIAPNPVRDFVQISFSMRDAGSARMEVYATDGRLVAVPFEGNYGVGDHAETLSLQGVPAGNYTLVLTASQSVRTQRLVVVR